MQKNAKKTKTSIDTNVSNLGIEANVGSKRFQQTGGVTRLTTLKANVVVRRALNTVGRMMTCAKEALAGAIIYGCCLN